MATLKQLQSWIQLNPHKSACLVPYKHASQTIEGPEETPDAEGWSKIQVLPPTPLSAILLLQDTIYGATLDSARRSFLRDETTDLQEKASALLKGRAWPIRRTAEGLSAIGLEEGRASTWTELGWRALAILRECQLVILDETKQTIHFYPEDIRTWSQTTDIYFIDHEARYIWTHSTPIHLITWLTNHESAKWTISWPLADGSMEELRSAATLLQLNTSGKIKEVLRKLVGHGQAIQLLSKWKTS
jgi:hypothetical protein